MDNPTALKQARALAKRRASSAFENEIAAELKRTYADGMVAASIAAGILPIYRDDTEQSKRFRSEADRLEGK